MIALVVALFGWANLLAVGAAVLFLKGEMDQMERRLAEREGRDG